MAKIEVKLKESYPNPFSTTTTGYILRKVGYSEVDEDDIEIQALLKGNSLDVKGADTLQEKINIIEPKAEE